MILTTPIVVEPVNDEEEDGSFTDPKSGMYSFLETRQSGSFILNEKNRKCPLHKPYFELPFQIS